MGVAPVRLPGYLVLQQLDRRLLESLLPASAFYNLMLSARKPPRRGLT